MWCEWNRHELYSPSQGESDVNDTEINIVLPRVNVMWMKQTWINIVLPRVNEMWMIHELI